MNIGVLALQGGIKEHLVQIEAIGHKCILVREKKDLDNLDAIILPGGESTTMGKLLEVTGLKEPLREKIMKGLPTFGTCAGMILLAKNIENQEDKHLAVMDISVMRNGFGTQINSFKIEKNIKDISENNIEMVFIRAPYITEVSRNVEVLCKVKNHIVAVKQGNILATSFHPELTKDVTVLSYFLKTFVKK